MESHILAFHDGDQEEANRFMAKRRSQDKGTPCMTVLFNTGCLKCRAIWGTVTVNYMQGCLVCGLQDINGSKHGGGDLPLV